MTTADLCPQEVARRFLRAGLPLPADRLALVTATARHIQHVIGALRALDLEDVPPAATYRAAVRPEREERADAAV